MNSVQSSNSVANDSWENNPLAPFFKGESMIRQQYHSCPAYRGNSFLKAIYKSLEALRKLSYRYIVNGILAKLIYIVKHFRLSASGI